MTVRVEFFGIPRQRAGIEAVDIDATNLGDAIETVGLKFPALAECCFNETSLKQGYLGNINGKRFTSDPETLLEPGDTVMILSADVGG
jgi:molybdopterin converting factor small subunit